MDQQSTNPDDNAPCADGEDDDACDGSDDTAPINQGPADGAPVADGDDDNGLDEG